MEFLIYLYWGFTNAADSGSVETDSKTLVINILITLVFYLFLAAIPANIAKSKGRNMLTWWVYGFCLFFISIIHALCLKKPNVMVEAEQIKLGVMKKCPYCAEIVKAEATICKHCHKELIES